MSGNINCIHFLWFKFKLTIITCVFLSFLLLQYKFIFRNFLAKFVLNKQIVSIYLWFYHFYYCYNTKIII